MSSVLNSLLPTSSKSIVSLQEEITALKKEMAATRKSVKNIQNALASLGNGTSPVVGSPGFDESHYNTFVSRALQSFEQIEEELRTKHSSTIELGTPKDTSAKANRRIYASAHRTQPITDTTVLWESHYGAGMVCSPYAMFRHMIDDQKYHHLSHLWVISDASERERLTKAYSRYDNVKFISNTSEEYFEGLATAGYIIGNVSLPTFFAKRPGQTIVNTWHSVTVKTLGFDQKNGRVEARNVLRSFLATDFLVSPNPFMTETYIRAFKLNNIFSGKIIETGFPRADLLRLNNKEEVIEKLKSQGVDIQPGKKVLLFAPTWRGDTVSQATAEYDGFSELITTIHAKVDTRKYQLIIKPHNLMFQALRKAKADLSGYVPPSVDPNELLSVVDVLISDYSSIFYDFMPTGKPILFYIPDLDQYEKDRGIVLPVAELPGPATKDPGDIADWLNSESLGITPELARLYKEKAAWAGPFDDGLASKRVVESVFDKMPVRSVPTIESAAKEKILFYGGTLQMNGVTTSLLALLKLINLKRFDVTVYTVAPSDPMQAKILSWIPKKVRVIVRVDTTPMTVVEEPKTKRFLSGDLPFSAYHDPDIQATFAREFRRSFGDAKFDYLADYSGYSLYWPALFAQATEAKTFIWQHNELERDFGNDTKRSASQAKRGAPSIASMAGVYEYVDRIVACGESVMKLNRKAMATPHTFSKFTHVQNIVDFSRVLDGMKNRHCFAPPPLDKYSKTVFRAQPIDKGDGTRRPSTYFYADVSTDNKTGIKARNTKIPLPSEKNINFVTIGRFSSEKNHVALIHAFALFSEETPTGRLYIIGDGALRPTYEKLIAKLELGKRVFLTGALKNPFGLASLCDCFVLPSIYEGLPISPLEARTMKLPLVMSRFNSVDSVSLPNGQYIVGVSEGAILEGLRGYRDGHVPNDAEFDPTAYNLVGLKDFYNVLKEAKIKSKPAVQLRATR